MSPKQAGAREIALAVLGRVRRDGAYANLALSAELERRGLSRVERGLATELVYGTLRHRRFVDHVIARFLKRKSKGLDPDVGDVLRLASYQLLFLDRVPNYAAVNEAVALTRRLRGARVAGFVNAVLRRVAEERPARAECDDFALRCSLPSELAEELVAQRGQDEAERLAEALLEPAALVVRANATRGTWRAAMAALRAEGASVEAVEHCPGALRVGGLDRPFQAASYLQGLWTAQDTAAQLVTLLWAPQKGERMLDACAGVGGKATHLAELSGEAPLCWDRNERKLQILAEHALRLGLRHESRVGDFCQAGPEIDGRFDCVLVDAPCSGIGVLRRHPELKWRVAGDRGELVALQRRLLERAVGALAPGGRLVYSVCTITEEEGPRQREWMLQRFSSLRVAAPRHDSPLRVLAPEGELRLWPHLHGTDGFYAVRLEKRG